MAIADDGRNDWVETANGRKVPNKELVLRSKLRIETRRFHMERLHRDTWGEKQQVEAKIDMTRLSPDERKRKADELLVILRELAAGPPKRPPLVYDPTESEDEPQPEPEGGIGRRTAR